jgi:hypothetical protein
MGSMDLIRPLGLAARPPVGRARDGVRWCRPQKDLLAALAVGGPVRDRLPWMPSCEANSAWARDDPMPLLRGKLAARAARRPLVGRR